MPNKRFNEFSKESVPLEGEKKRIDDILNQEIKVTEYKIQNSRFNKNNNPKCLMMQFELAGAKYVIFTGSNVLIDQIERYEEEIPFYATIKKIDRYYTFT